MQALIQRWLQGSEAQYGPAQILIYRLVFLTYRLCFCCCIASEEKQPVRAGILRLTHIPEFHCYAKMKSGRNIYTGKHTRDALIYELLDMEKAINGVKKCMLLDYTKDVMDMMTEFRNSWNFKYPEEEL